MTDTPDQNSPTGNTSPPVMARPVSTPSRRPPLHLPNLDRRAAYLDLGLLLMVALVYPLANMVVAALGQEGIIPDGDVAGLFIAQMWLQFILYAGLAAYLLLRHRLNPASFGLGPMAWDRLLSWSAAGLIAAFVVVATVGIVTFQLADWFGWVDTAEEVAQRTNFGKLLPNTLLGAAALMIPVAASEELLFRGLLLPYLRRVTGRWWTAIVISSLVFGALHFTQGLLALIPIACLGVLLAVVFILTRSLWPVVIVHFAFNMIQFSLIRWALPKLQEIAEQTTTAPA